MNNKFSGKHTEKLCSVLIFHTLMRNNVIKTYRGNGSRYSVDELQLLDCFVLRKEACLRLFCEIYRHVTNQFHSYSVLGKYQSAPIWHPLNHRKNERHNLILCKTLRIWGLTPGIPIVVAFVLLSLYPAQRYCFSVIIRQIELLSGRN